MGGHLSVAPKDVQSIPEPPKKLFHPTSITFLILLKNLHLIVAFP